MEKTFIEDYLHYTEGNESPVGFHIWSALAALSVGAGRRFWLRTGDLCYYPHTYILLVAEPGVKKSSAMDRAKEMVREAEICPMAASQTTREAIGKMMSHEKYRGKKYFIHAGKTEEYNQLAIFSTEFTQFLSVNPEGMLEFLTSVFGEKVHSTDYKNAGSDFVLAPYITLLGCLTPHMLSGYLKLNVLTGGFARRTLFVYGFMGDAVPIPRFLPSQEEARLRCVSFLKRLQARSGEFTFGPGAEDWYSNWYITCRKNLKEISSPRTEAYHLTKHEQLLKVCMLLALAEESDLVIHVDHLETAEQHFFKPYIDKNLERVFEGTGINPNASAALRITHMIEAMTVPIPEKKLLGLFGDQVTDYRALQDTIGHLINVGRLARAEVKIGGQLIGNLIGTSECLAKYSHEQLLAFLKPSALPSE